MRWVTRVEHRARSSPDTIDRTLDECREYRSRHHLVFTAQASVGLFEADAIELFDTENGQHMFLAVAGKPCDRLPDPKTDQGGTDRGQYRYSSPICRRRKDRRESRH